MNDLMTTKERQTLEAIADEFVSMYDNQIVIPIIGEEILSVKNKDGIEMPLVDYVISKFEERYPDNNFFHLKPNNNNPYYVFSCIIRQLGGASKGSLKFKTFYIQLINEAINQGRIFINQPYLDFLKVFDFPLIITTSCFNIFEDILNTHVASKYDSIYYNPDKDNTGPDIEEHLNNHHIIYHIFGSSNNKKIGSTSWVYNEETLLDFIHKIHNDDSIRSCKNLSSYTNSKSAWMLILGCTLPDWLFRFLWYPFGNDNKSDRTGYWLRESECNVELKNFLESINYLSLNMVTEFLKLATEKKRALIREFQEKYDTPQSYDYFISYASEDENIASLLYETLKTRGRTVYFDKRGEGEIKGGDLYEKMFARGVEQSTRALALITENYIRAVSNPKRGLCTETEYIKKKAEVVDNGDFKFCIPVLVENRVFNNKPLTETVVETWSTLVTSIDGGLAPLFEGVSMEKFDINNPNAIRL